MQSRVLSEAGVEGAWQLAAELHLQNEDHKACISIVKEGLGYQEDRQKAGDAPQLRASGLVTVHSRE